MLYGSIIVILGWVTGWFLLWRTGVCRISPAERKSPSGGRHVSVIVPARNEEGRLPPLLASLAAQSVPPGEIIVVDDGSTDGTAALARRSGARVVAPGPLPAGWLGKPWACHRGTEAARGSVFVFLDADIRLEEDGLERLLAVQARKGGLLSVQPYHEVKRPYEHLSAFFNLIVPASTAAFTPFGDMVAPKASFGPCIVCSRADYTAAGGHWAVRGEVLENLALGRRFQASGLPLVCRAGRGTVAFRMYPEGMGSLVRGWSKSFASGARTTALPVLLAVVLWLAGGASAGIRLGETAVTAAMSVSRSAADSAAKPVSSVSRSAADSAAKLASSVSRSAADSAAKPASSVSRSAADSAAKPVSSVSRSAADSAAKLASSVSRSAADSAAKPASSVSRSAADSAAKLASSVSRSAADSAAKPASSVTEAVTPVSAAVSVGRPGASAPVDDVRPASTVGFAVSAASAVQPVIPKTGAGQPLLIAALIYTAYALQITILLRRTGNFHLLTGLLYPVPLIFFFGLFGWSAVLTFLRKRVSWKGRDISVTKNRGAS
ncbi:glycosyltransferase [Paenibacillus sp. 1P03SA]|uniref:glycosyltransferase n=1 Tax=Paenibacillus sp. 1P03SA TaxID=3132294 RepID=UPI0039A18F0F